MKAETLSALERLQADLRKDGQGTFAWLDAHQADVLKVVAEKGPGLTEELLGIEKTALYAWARSRRLTPLSKPPPKRERAPRPGPPQDQDAAYWRGRAEALMEVVNMLLQFRKPPGGPPGGPGLSPTGEK